MRDPVCQKHFRLREAGAMTVHHGRAYYFCCDACRARFDADPTRYQDEVQAQRLTVGVMGSASRELEEPAERLLQVNFSEHFRRPSCFGAGVEGNRDESPSG